MNLNLNLTSISAEGLLSLAAKHVVESLQSDLRERVTKALSPEIDAAIEKVVGDLKAQIIADRNLVQMQDHLVVSIFNRYTGEKKEVK